MRPQSPSRPAPKRLLADTEEAETEESVPPPPWKRAPPPPPTATATAQPATRPLGRPRRGAEPPRRLLERLRGLRRGVDEAMERPRPSGARPGLDGGADVLQSRRLRAARALRVQPDQQGGVRGRAQRHHELDQKVQRRRPRPQPQRVRAHVDPRVSFWARVPAASPRHEGLLVVERYVEVRVVHTRNIVVFALYGAARSSLALNMTRLECIMLTNPPPNLPLSIKKVNVTTDNLQNYIDKLQNQHTSTFTTHASQTHVL